MKRFVAWSGSDRQRQTHTLPGSVLPIGQATVPCMYESIGLWPRSLDPVECGAIVSLSRHGRLRPIKQDRSLSLEESNIGSLV